MVLPAYWSGLPAYWFGLPDCRRGSLSPLKGRCVPTLREQTRLLSGSTLAHERIASAPSWAVRASSLTWGAVGFQAAYQPAPPTSVPFAVKVQVSVKEPHLTGAYARPPRTRHPL